MSPKKVPDPFSPAGGVEPVFGIIILGGPVCGSRVLEVNLANELASRGYRVHAWWALDRPHRSGLRPEIEEHWLFNCARYLRLMRIQLPDGIADAIGRALSGMFPDGYWSDRAEARPWAINAFMRGFVRVICAGVERDRGLIRRFARQLSKAGVTHVIASEAELSPWVFAARRRVQWPVKCLVQFQGYALTANYARADGREQPFYDRLRECVLESDWPAVAVSDDFRRRAISDIGLGESSIRTIRSGVLPPTKIAREEALKVLSAQFEGFRPDVPLITYLGRRDAEKGIDLLLYAAAMLRVRGHNVQVAVCGPTLHGTAYADSCRLIAENLRLRVFWRSFVDGDLRASLYSLSHAVVYPSIFREPFGMVAVEALSYGTPAVIPDTGGIVEAVRADGRTGALLFRSWDSGHLAEQIERLLKEPALRRQLSEAGPHVAAFHSVTRMTDGLLEHMGLPGQNPPLSPEGPRLSSRWPLVPMGLGVPEGDSGSQREGPEGESE